MCIAPNRRAAQEEARRWVRRRRIFYTILGAYLALSLMWFFIDMADDSENLWFYWPMLGAGSAVAMLGVVLFGVGSLSGAEWEGRQMQRYLERHRVDGDGGGNGAEE